MHALMTVLLLSILQRSFEYVSGAPSGIGLEWMTIASVVVPAVLLLVLIYLGAEESV